MTGPPIGDTTLKALEEFFSSPRFVSALTTAAIATAVLAFAIRQTIGWPGLIAILAVLAILIAASLLARREMTEWYGLLPISLLVFVAWAGVSIFWSEYQWSTLGGLAYLFAFTVIGVFVALVRDTIQIVRVYGNVLRVVLAASIALEILAGVLIDTPIEFLGIEAQLAELGPIQGLLGTRNQLGLIAVIAIVTFVTELRTRSVELSVSIGSLVLAFIAAGLTRSPVAAGALVVVGVAALVLFGLRRAPAEARRMYQLGLLAALVVGSALAWIFRSNIVNAFNGGGELSYRLRLWQQTRELILFHPLEGWGWIGHWRQEYRPFEAFVPLGERPPTSALNAYIDIWFQLGMVGLAIFVGMVGLTFVRSWLLGSQKRSTVFTWPALVLVVLVLSGLAESSMIVEFGWVTLVVCCVKASQHLSWRQAFAASEPPPAID